MKKVAIIVITHGNFGKELIRSSEMILGKLENIYSLSLLEEMDPLDLVEELQEVLNNGMDHYIILTDLFGGSPANVASRFALEKNVTVLTGVNLPMLVEAEMARMQNNLEALNVKLLNCGQEGIKDVEQIILERKAEK